METDEVQGGYVVSYAPLPAPWAGCQLAKIDDRRTAGTPR
jgi:hypothetical protein